MSESETSSASQIFRIKRQIYQTRQGIADVTTYFNVLKGLLVELDLYRNIEFESAADAKKFNDIMERDRVIQFLVGLNPEYDEVCHQLLAKEPFPDLEEAFVYVRGEENNRGLKREIDKARTESSDIASTSGSQMAQTGIGMNQNLGMSEQQQAQSGVQRDGANNNSVASILLSQLASAKFVKIWEGNLSGQRQGQPVFITRLEGYRNVTASETLAANWPATVQVVRLISQDHMNNKQYVGKADFLVFRAMNQHGILGQFQERKLCAVIQLPSQTLLLAVSDNACRLIGLLLPEDAIAFTDQIPSQQQQQEQTQQQQQLLQIQQLRQLQQHQQLPQLQQRMPQF